MFARYVLICYIRCFEVQYLSADCCNLLENLSFVLVSNTQRGVGGDGDY